MTDCFKVVFQRGETAEVDGLTVHVELKASH